MLSVQATPPDAVLTGRKYPPPCRFGRGRCGLSQFNRIHIQTIPMSYWLAPPKQSGSTELETASQYRLGRAVAVAVDISRLNRHTL